MKTAKLQFTPQWHSALSDYVTTIAWSADGLAAASAQGEVVLFDAAGVANVLCEADGQAINCLAWSSDDTSLAAGGQAGIVTVWDQQSSDRSPLLQTTHPGVWIDQLAWHPVQNILAYGVNTQVELWQVKLRKSIISLPFQASSVLHLAWHPQGEFLAVSGHGGLKVWSQADWDAAPKDIPVPGASLYAAWSADGRYLGSGNLDRTLTVAEWNSPPPWLMQGFPGKVRQLAWSTPVTPSGSPLLAAACVEGVTVWERSSDAGSGWRSRVLQHHQDRVNAIAFQPQSLLLASASQDGQIALWQNGKSLSQTLKGFSQGVTCLSWNAAGDKLAAGGVNGELKVWRVAQTAKGFG